MFQGTIAGQEACSGLIFGSADDGRGGFAVAHKKGRGSTQMVAAQPAVPGRQALRRSSRSISIIVRQCGTKFHPGHLVRMGKDNTLYAVSSKCDRGRYVPLDSF